MTRSAADPWLNGRPPHLPISSEEGLPAICLLPGDPARVDRAGQVLDDFRLLGQNREFRLGVGRVGAVEVAVCSTGIGGPSTEIALVELARLGVHTVIRTGGMGALAAHIAPGDLCVVTTAVRDGGAAACYADPATPAQSSPEVSAALRAAAASAGETPHDIGVISCDSYYVGEGRPVPGLEGRAAARLAEIESRSVDGMDMECETVLVVGAALGLRVGGILVAHASRATDQWLEDYEPAQLRMLRVAVTAAGELGRAPTEAR
ncbi:MULTISPECIES: nucleoside phosphorylase [Actinoalloteichus]|uniref:Uridine phosphorylase n=1 Tax=Actinoalloteichus fjordicus TaxID=1612552 RepID=A0AAC9LFN5_9PSEU|nr:MULTISPECIES: nucleoside phosphorylase [Actinoalloteichus]APU16816.1 uridine phosphorylase [Actinoalloteichus fjordicus]APU22881.1 uridine phosphorylase [Actinoalloteichus sp. GBA129-24]